MNLVLCGVFVGRNYFMTLHFSVVENRVRLCVSGLQSGRAATETGACYLGFMHALFTKAAKYKVTSK